MKKKLPPNFLFLFVSVQRYSLVLLALLLSVLLAPSAPAQTVESVLRALQERKIAVLYKTPTDHAALTDKDLIKWPHYIPHFPAEGSITELWKVLAALNAASYAFDALKLEFVAYDVKNQVFANLGCPYYIDSVSGAPNSTPSPSSIDLPSVGQFDESNWKTKLRLLASNINQLRALMWPMTRMETWASGNKSFSSLSSAPEMFPFPGQYPNGPASYTEKFTNSTFGLYWDIKGYHGSELGDVTVSEMVTFPSGFKAVAGLQGDRTVPNTWPKLTGALRLFKSPLAHHVTDFTEELAKTVTSPALLVEVPKFETPEQRVGALR